MFFEKLGEDYLADSLEGAYFLYNGEPVRVQRVYADNVLVSVINEEDSTISVHPSEFKGWRTLKFPRLGYRKLSNGLWGWVSRSARSYSRGLGVENLNFTLTPFLQTERGERAVYNRGSVNPEHFYQDVTEGKEGYSELDAFHVVMEAALLPVFDGKDVLRKVFEGEALSFIPSPRYLVEPEVVGGPWAVFMAGHKIGSIDRNLNIKAPLKSAKLIEGMVKRYAA